MRLRGDGILAMINNNTTNYPPYVATGAPAFSWNFSGGKGEAVIWNNNWLVVPDTGSEGFDFRQMTGASTSNRLMYIDGYGRVNAKLREITYHSYNIAGVGAATYEWVPAPGGETTNDVTGLPAIPTTSAQKYGTWVAPYGGRLVRMVIKCYGNNSGTVITNVQAAMAVNNTVTEYSPAFNLTPITTNANAGTAVTIIDIPIGTAGFSFNAGDFINAGFYIPPAIASTDMYVVLVWEYDIK